MNTFVLPPFSNRTDNNRKSDVSFGVQLYSTPFYMEANYKYPMNVSLNSKVYVEAFIEGG